MPFRCRRGAEYGLTCRNGIVIGGWGDGVAASPLEFAGAAAPVHRAAWPRMAVAIAALSVALTLLPGRTQIPPLIESDYCHQLIAADRMHQGLGLTSLQPVAPRQPWTWRYDFGFLTQWPPGYSLLVAAVRRIGGVSTVQACRGIGIIACAAAFVGWFTWVRRNVPSGIAGLLLATAAAASTVSVALLASPSTDAVLVAALPYILLLVTKATGQSGDGYCSRFGSNFHLALAGLLASGLFSVRYASLFVPAGISAYLTIELLRRRPAEWSAAPSGGKGVMIFTLFAAAPIIAVVLLNRALAGGALFSQLNLGVNMGFSLALRPIAAAWWRFTDVGIFGGSDFLRGAAALWPVAVVGGAAVIRPARSALLSFIKTPGVCLSACVAAALLVMLITATTLFGEKYSYVYLDRYYLPVRPLCMLLLAAPVLLIRAPLARFATGVVLLLICTSLVGQSWPKSYRKALAAQHPTTNYGQRAVCFEPGARELYEWLGRSIGRDVIIFSNFREYIALETGIAALPIPRDQSQLDDWIGDVSKARGIDAPRVLFVLDPDNRWRTCWLPAAETIAALFQLRPLTDAPQCISARLLEYFPTSNVLTRRE